jgi:hypothetical protein
MLLFLYGHLANANPEPPPPTEDLAFEVSGDVQDPILEVWTSRTVESEREPWGWAFMARPGIHLLARPPLRDLDAVAVVVEQSLVWRFGFSPVDGFSVGFDAGAGVIPGMFASPAIPLGAHAEVSAYVALGNDGTRPVTIPVGWVAGVAGRADVLAFVHGSINHPNNVVLRGVRPALFSEVLFLLPWAVGLRTEYHPPAPTWVGRSGPEPTMRIGGSIVLGGTF